MPRVVPPICLAAADGILAGDKEQPLRRLGVILLLLAISSPVLAVGGWLGVANGGRDTVWRQPDGTFQVFGRPTEILGRRSFGSGVRSEERRVGKECRARWAPDH